MWRFCARRRILFPESTALVLSRCRPSRLFEDKPCLLFRCTQEGFRMRTVLRPRAKIRRRGQCFRMNPRSWTRPALRQKCSCSAIPSSRGRAVRRSWLLIRAPQSAWSRACGCEARRFGSRSRPLHPATPRGPLFRFAMPSPFYSNKASCGMSGHHHPQHHLLRMLRSPPLIGLSGS